MQQVDELAGQAVAYVQRALGITLGYDSETLPVLDHYISTVPRDRPEMIELVTVTAGAYFGEVVRRQIGARWEMDNPAQAMSWRIVLPTGLNFSPMGFVAAAIVGDELGDVDTAFDAPPAMLPYVEVTLGNMSEQSDQEYYSLCGRYDTLAHLHEVLVAVAASRLDAVEANQEAADEASPQAPAADESTRGDAGAPVRGTGTKPPGGAWN